jgi:hypothetical protein
MTVKQLDDVVVKISPWILALTKKKKYKGLFSQPRYPNVWQSSYISLLNNITFFISCAFV